MFTYTTSSVSSGDVSDAQQYISQVAALTAAAAAAAAAAAPEVTDVCRGSVTSRGIANVVKQA